MNALPLDAALRTAGRSSRAPASGGSRARRIRHGAMLLEVVVALTILSTSGIAVVMLAGQSRKALEHARASEREVRDANAFLHAVSLWTREDLDRRLGSRSQGAWRLKILHPLPSLYTIALIDALSGAEVLRSSLFRPEPPHVEP